MNDKVKAAVEAIYKRDGVLEADSVVEASKDASSPLHKYFKWDDDAGAAHEWRLSKAREIITSFNVVYVHKKRTPQEIPNVIVPEFSRKPRQATGYGRTVEIINGPDKEEFLVTEYKMCLGHVQRFCNHLRAGKFHHEAAAIDAAMEAALEAMQKKLSKAV